MRKHNTPVHPGYFYPQIHTDVAPPHQIHTDVAPPHQIHTDVAPPHQIHTDVAPPHQIHTDVAPPQQGANWPQQGHADEWQEFVHSMIKQNQGVHNQPQYVQAMQESSFDNNYLQRGGMDYGAMQGMQFSQPHQQQYFQPQGTLQPHHGHKMSNQSQDFPGNPGNMPVAFDPSQYQVIMNQYNSQRQIMNNTTAGDSRLPNQMGMQYNPQQGTHALQEVIGQYDPTQQKHYEDLRKIQNQENVMRKRDFEHYHQQAEIIPSDIDQQPGAPETALLPSDLLPPNINGLPISKNSDTSGQDVDTSQAPRLHQSDPHMIRQEINPMSYAAMLKKAAPAPEYTGKKVVTFVPQQTPQQHSNFRPGQQMPGPPIRGGFHPRGGPPPNFMPDRRMMNPYEYARRNGNNISNRPPHLQQVNPPPEKIDLNPKNARFFVIKSFSEDDVHKCMKYNIWASTDAGNRRLDAAQQQQRPLGGSVYLFFSVNKSGRFCGVALMDTVVDHAVSFGAWAETNKWRGQFKVTWLYIKDIPNREFKHIKLANNDYKPITNSRDTQEVPLELGIQVLNIFSHYKQKTSILDDFDYYDMRQMDMEETKRRMEQHIKQQQALSFPTLGDAAGLSFRERGGQFNKRTKDEENLSNKPVNVTKSIPDNEEVNISRQSDRGGKNSGKNMTKTSPRYLAIATNETGLSKYGGR